MAIAIRVFVFEVLLATIFVSAAGTWDVPWFWAMLAVHALMVSSMFIMMSPELRAERLHPGPGGTDRAFRFLAMPFILGHIAVAGLDVGRYHWSGELPTWLHLTGLAGYILGLGLSGWAVVTNRFFSSVVRIQEERGHHVVTGGPYRLIRHPGYAGTLIAAACGGVVIGSWWSLVPLAVLVPLFLRRTLLEEELLRERLTGYSEYASRVRFRLVPGLW